MPSARPGGQSSRSEANRLGTWMFALAQLETAPGLLATPAPRFLRSSAMGYVGV